MSLTLHYHPLSSFCHKVLIALYEKQVDFQPKLVNLGDPAERQAFRDLWPVGKFPVLQDSSSDQVIAESSIIIESLELHQPTGTRLIPEDTEAALQVRRLDRLFDLYIHLPMQKIVGDRLRPEGSQDPHGVEEARQTMRTAFGIVQRELEGRAWAAGESFTLADCAAAPALFYADKVMPIAPTHPQLAAYLGQLKQRPSYARVLDEAQPYFLMFPA